MPEIATTIPAKGLGKVRWYDVLKAVFYACIGQLLALIGFFFTSLLQEHPHFPTWVEWLPYVKATLYAIGGYIAGKFGINNVGQILTRDKPVVHVNAEKLDVLEQKAATLDASYEAKKNS